MKKYIVKYANGEKTFGEYESKEKASAKLIEFINLMNKGLGVDFFSPFDFCLEKVECEVNEEITDLENARKALDVESNSDFVSAKIADVARLVNEINPKHIEALVALNRLLTIAEAWNKADGFAPDFFDMEQDKWYPTFEYYKEKGLVFHRTVQKVFGTKLCFKTSERAEQFGKKFVELYNKVFL